MEKLSFQIKIEVEHSVKDKKIDLLESQLEHKAEQLGNLITTKIREAVKMADGEIGTPKLSKSFSVKKKSTKKE